MGDVFDLDQPPLIRKSASLTPLATRSKDGATSTYVCAVALEIEAEAACFFAFPSFFSSAARSRLLRRLSMSSTTSLS